MLASFLSWWIGRLAELLPAGLRTNPDAPPDAVLLRIDDTGRVGLARRRAGQVAALAEGAPPPRGLPQCLVLPESFMLERKIELPIAVAREANRVVSLDFDRLTPFRADQTIWGLFPLGDDKSRGVAQFSLGLIPKARLEPLLVALRQRGLRPGTLECVRTGRPPRRLTIAGGIRNDLSTIIALSCVGLLLIAAVASPFIRQQIELGRIEARIVAVNDQAELASRLLRRISPGGQSADRLLTAQAQAPRALHVLAAITAALPDDTTLVSLSLQDDRLEIEGTSDSAARLIGLLAAQNPIRDPNFSSPVTRTIEGKDAFSLSASVVGPSVPSSSPAQSGFTP